MRGALLATARTAWRTSTRSAALRAGSDGVGFVGFARCDFLAVQGVEGDDAARQFQRPEQFGRGGDLLAPAGAAIRAKAPPCGDLAPLGSLHLSITALWPSARPCLVAQALTPVPTGALRLRARGSALPSSVTDSAGCQHPAHGAHQQLVPQGGMATLPHRRVG